MTRKQPKAKTHKEVPMGWGRKATSDGHGNSQQKNEDSGTTSTHYTYRQSPKFSRKPKAT